MKNVTTLLGGESGVEYNGVSFIQSNTEAFPATGLIVGEFFSGRTDKPMTITKDNLKPMLGYDPKNPSYIAIQDALNSGMESIQVLRLILPEGTGFKVTKPFVCNIPNTNYLPTSASLDGTSIQITAERNFNCTLLSSYATFDLTTALNRSLKNKDMQQWQAFIDAVNELTGGREWLVDDVNNQIVYYSDPDIKSIYQYIFRNNEVGINVYNTEQAKEVAIPFLHKISNGYHKIIACKLSANGKSMACTYGFNGKMSDVRSLSFTSTTNPAYDKNLSALKYVWGADPSKTSIKSINAEFALVKQCDVNHGVGGYTMQKISYSADNLSASASCKANLTPTSVYRFANPSFNESKGTVRINFDQVSKKIITNVNSSNQGISLLAEAYIDTVKNSIFNQDKSKQFIKLDDLIDQFEMNKNITGYL